jgi:hypothetical protein
MGKAKTTAINIEVSLIFKSNNLICWQLERLPFGVAGLLVM